MLALNLDAVPKVYEAGQVKTLCDIAEYFWKVGELQTAKKVLWLSHDSIAVCNKSASYSKDFEKFVIETYEV